MGRCQLHNLEAPYSIGVGCRAILHVRKTYAVEGDHGTYDGGFLLHRFEKGDLGHFYHVIVGKGESVKKLKKFADFHE